MGIKSITNTDRLYWLGRYTERVYTTLRLYCNSFDQLIEQYGGDHKKFCASLEIPDIYKDKDDFIETYAFSKDDPNSIMSNLCRAYDNAIELRDEIGSETLAFIQMAVYQMEAAHYKDSLMLYFQKVTDAILAFWGCVDDEIDDENTRNIIKIGKRVERLDLYARLRKDAVAIRREVNRLAGRINRTDLVYNQFALEYLKEIVKKDTMDYDAIIRVAENLVQR